MWSVFFPVDSSGNDNLVAELWERGTAGILEEPDGLRTFFDDESTAKTVSSLSANAQIRFEPTQVPEAAPQDCEPILVGDRFWIGPPGCRVELPPGRLRLQIDSATAFGTGRHETTQLCLEALEKYLRPDFVVLDIGCGSGILSQAARLLGARQVYSCDIQGDAAAQLQGSADSFASACADLVLANITAAVVDNLAFELQRVVKPDGLVVISGFIRENPPRCFSPAAVLAQEDWLCWICHPAGVTPLPRPPEGLSHKADWWL